MRRFDLRRFLKFGKKSICFCNFKLRRLDLERDNFKLRCLDLRRCNFKLRRSEMHSGLPDFAPFLPSFFVVCRISGAKNNNLVVVGFYKIMNLIWFTFFSVLGKRTDERTCRQTDTHRLWKLFLIDRHNKQSGYIFSFKALQTSA